MTDPHAVPADQIRAMHSVAGRVVIVTGSGQGVGRGMAHHFAKAGATVVVADWNAEKMARTVAECRELGAEALGVQCNIMEQETLQAMVDTTVGEYGRVDAIVNNAQTFRPNAPVAEVPNASVPIQWDVANTTASPVSCSLVDILLSTDGGYTYPTTLLANTPNDGSQNVTLPNINTTTARIMVRGDNNYFFDVTNAFQIQGALPVEWLEFTASLQNKRDALLQWKTATETNNAGFEVEMSSESADAFKKAGFVGASPEHFYQFTIPALEDGEYYFRLKQIDQNGAISYSPIRSLQIGKQQTTLSVFPNPAQNELNVLLPAGAQTEVKLEIINQVGQVLRTLVIGDGRELLPIDIADLPAGVYVLYCHAGEQTQEVRFTKK